MLIFTSLSSEKSWLCSGSWSCTPLVELQRPTDWSTHPFTYHSQLLALCLLLRKNSQSSFLTPYSFLVSIPTDSTVGVPVILLKNLKGPWLCYGTRLVVKKRLYQAVVKLTYIFSGTQILSKPLIQFSFLELQTIIVFGTTKNSLCFATVVTHCS